jgi:hypothetical protein
MAISRRDFKRGSRARTQALIGYGAYPHATQTLDIYESFATTTADDLTVGTEALSQSYPVPACGIALSYTEAAGSAAAATFTLTGINHLGVEVTETMAIVSTSVAHSANAYIQITSLVVTAASGLNNADTLKVGLVGTASYTVVGIPARIELETDLVGVIQEGPPAKVGVLIAYTVDLERSTVKITGADPGGGGGTLLFIFNPNARVL